MSLQTTLKDDDTIRVLLVDDQEMVSKLIARMLEGEDDIEFHYCQDPSKAIQIAVELKPTVILQDLVMPNVDGMTLVKFFRANPATKDIPMIVLSSKEEPKVKAEAFACGANDYMVKLPDKLEVIARLRYHSRGYIAMLQRNHAYEALAKELSDAADYVISLLPAPIQTPMQTQWVYIPSAQLGGDCFGYHWLDNDHFAMYLLDVCGHGVGAALLGVSAMNVLRFQALPEVDMFRPAEVLAGLNNMFSMDENQGMFFTIWYGVYNKSTRQLTYSSGGHPPAVLFGDSGFQQFGTPGIVIGAMPEMAYQEASFEIPAGSVMYLFSDGAYEVTVKETGEMWDDKGWHALLEEHSSNPTQDITMVRESVAELQGSDEFEDDFSLLQVVFPE